MGQRIAMGLGLPLHVVPLDASLETLALPAQANAADGQKISDLFAFPINTQTNSRALARPIDLHTHPQATPSRGLPA
jgi:hypothetical protein